MQKQLNSFHREHMQWIDREQGCGPDPPTWKQPLCVWMYVNQLCVYVCQCLFVIHQDYKNKNNPLSLQQNFPFLQRSTITRLIGCIMSRCCVLSIISNNSPQLSLSFLSRAMSHLVSFSALGSVVNSDHETDAMLEISCQWWRFILIWTEHAAQH